MLLTIAAIGMAAWGICLAIHETSVLLMTYFIKIKEEIYEFSDQ